MRDKICHHYIAGDGKGYGEHKWGYSCSLLVGHKGEHSPYPEQDRQGLTCPTVLLDAEKEKVRLIERVNVINSNIAAYKKYCQITCLGRSVNHGKGGCGTKHKVNDLTYIQTHWYTPPSGCTDGDYWNQGEGQFICPTCGELNRLYERPAVMALKSFFKEVQNSYER
jgi:hypothetical protein